MPASWSTGRARPAEAKGVQILPKCWIVERTLAWLGRYRRLSKDYEATTASSEAWITIAMIHLWCAASNRAERLFTHPRSDEVL